VRTITIVIVTLNNWPVLKRFLDSIWTHKHHQRLSVIVVDNGSNDNTWDMLMQWAMSGLSSYFIRNTENLGYGAGANIGIKRAQEVNADADILLCNDDMELLPGCIDNLAETFDRNKDAGMVGGKLLYPNGVIQHAGAFLNEAYIGYHYGQGKRPEDFPETPQEQVMKDFQFVTGAMVLIRGEVLKIVGGFDPAFGMGYYEDADMCWRVRDAGWQVIYNPNAKAIHHEGTTTRKWGASRGEILRKSRNAFIAKHAVPDWGDE